MDKFGRSYKLEIETSSGATLTIEPPLTVEFDITRNVLSSANISSIRVYNLSQKNRDQIRKDSWATWDLRSIVLYAGYGKNMPKIFAGNISQAWSVREGTNFITQIESFDSGFSMLNSQTNISFPAATPQRTVIQTLAGSMPDVSIGFIGNYSGVTGRGNSYSGNTADILRELTGGGFFIDNGKVYCLSDTECFTGEIAVIDSSTGLLGTPIREETFLNFDIIFEPRLVVGQKIELRSSTAANFNGFYKVVSVKHRGTISDAVCGNAVTSVGLFAPQLLSEVE